MRPDRKPARKPNGDGDGTIRKVDPRRVSVRTEGGKVSLANMPLVAYALNCGHLGRNYAVARGDYLFCEDCGTERRVSKVLAQ